MKLPVANARGFSHPIRFSAGGMIVALLRGKRETNQDIHCAYCAGVPNTSVCHGGVCPTFAIEKCLDCLMMNVGINAAQVTVNKA